MEAEGTNPGLFTRQVPIIILNDIDTNGKMRCIGDIILWLWVASIRDGIEVLNNGHLHDNARH